jgi:hypothetical protein
MYKFIEEPEKNNFNETIHDTLSHLDKRNKLLNIQNSKTKENLKLINQYEKKITNIKQNIITKKEEIKNIKELVNMKRKGKINILNLFKSYISILDDKNQCLNEKIDYIYKKELLVKYKEKIISNIYNSNNNLNNIINNHIKKEDAKINDNFSLSNRYLNNNINNNKKNLEKIYKKNLNNNFFLNNRKVSASSKNFNKSLTNNYNMNICNYNKENIFKRNSAKNMFKNNTSKSRLESSSYYRNKKNVNNSSINSKESEIYLSDDEEFNKFLKNYKIILDKNVSRNNLIINNKKSSSTNILSNFHYNNSTKAGTQKATLEKKINIPKKQVFLSQNEKSKEKNYYNQKENKKKIFYPLYNLGSFQQTHYSKNSATNNFSYSLLNNTKSKNNSSANLNNTNLNSTTYNNFYLKTARDNINKIKDPKLKQKIFNIVVTSELSERENFNNNNNNNNINNFNFNFNYNNNYLNNFHNNSNGFFYNEPISSNRENNKHSRNLNYLHKHNTNQTKSMKNLKRNNMLMSKDNDDFSKEVKKNKNTLFFNIKNKIEENKRKFIYKNYNIFIINIYKKIDFKIKNFQKDFFMKLKKHINFLYFFKKWNESNKKGKCFSRMLYLTFKKYNDIIKEKTKQNLVNDDEFLNQLYKTEESVKGNLSDYEGGLNQLKNITRETKQIEQFLNNFTQSINNKI